MPFFCLQLEVSCLQLNFLFTVMFENLFCLQLEFFTYMLSFFLQWDVLLTVGVCVCEPLKKIVSQKKQL